MQRTVVATREEHHLARGHVEDGAQAESQLRALSAAVAGLSEVGRECRGDAIFGMRARQNLT